MIQLKPMWLTAAAAGALLAGGALAQDAAAPIVNQSFEENDGGWQAVGGTGTISLTHDAALVKNGKGALQFAYDLKKAQFTLMMLPAPNQMLEKAKSLKFWVKADHGTTLAAVLQEKDGGRYTATFTAPKDSWQQVELSIADFVIDRSKDAPKDPDNKLDMDEVEGVAIADMAQMFVQGDANFAAALGVSEGPRKLYIDDFAVTATALPSTTSLKAGEGSVDLFVRPQIGWTTVGDMSVVKATGKPLDGAGLQAKYHQAPGRVCGMLHFIAPNALTGATKLTLSAASTKPAKLLVQLEETSGGKYNTIVELPGNSGRSDLSLSIADFKAADDSHDDNNKLDLDQVTQVLIMDVSGILDQTDADNTLWVNNVKAAK